MSILGVSAGFHDAALSVVSNQGNILFAGHSERYSKQKNDASIHEDLVHAVAGYDIDRVAFYERPWMHNIQQWRSGQGEYGPWTARGAVNKHLPYFRNARLPVKSYPHHLSHAAAGFQTSPFDWAAVVVIDAIGEMDTISIYRAWYDREGRAHYQKMWGQQYPHSVGLWYTAITERIGLRPMEDEYITMGMSAYGKSMLESEMVNKYIKDIGNATFSQNFHIGFEEGAFAGAKPEDIAHSAQNVTEYMIENIMYLAQQLTHAPNLVYMGGVALNCVANSKLHMWDRVWIMPNPGDAGSSLGAAALAYGKKLNWQTPYLGHIIPGKYPVNPILDELITNKIVGVASGAAEFGPRALGNRSLLADPRGADIKDRVNAIKRRQQFRPFAPVILEEYVDEYFFMPNNQPISPYMQTVARCKYPEQFPAIVHVDGTSRVQTVGRDCASGIRELLEKWNVLTGCPMLLNTSLNIRGEPMVNDRADADRFEREYGVRVCS
jgi:carbamoyltransferase